MASDNNSDITAPATAPVVTRQGAWEGPGQFWARVSDGRMAIDLDFAAPERATVTVAGSSRVHHFPRMEMVEQSTLEDCFPQREMVEQSTLEDHFTQREMVEQSTFEDRFPQREMVEQSTLEDHFTQREMVAQSTLEDLFPQREMVVGSSRVHRFPRTEMVEQSTLEDRFPQREMVFGSSLVHRFPRMKMQSTSLSRDRLRGRLQPEVTEKPWCIRKVPHRLREVNEKAYEPNVISIGPYHYGKQHLCEMEAIKQSCFDKIVEETRRDFSSFREVMRPLEERFLNCYEEYEEPFLLHTTGLVKMMILDGCFIVQLIRGVHPEEDIFEVGRIQTDIRFDLLLLENQLPFFVLFELYRIIVPNASGDVHGFARLALSNLFKMSDRSLPRKEIKHLLDLVHSTYHPSPKGIELHQNFKAKVVVEAREPISQRSWKFIRSATELEDAGICFFGDNVEKMKDVGEGIEDMFDIMFTKDTKVLKIPTLQVDDGTERFLRNFMAYEQFIPSGEPTYFVDYVVFMDNLINTGQDVQLLCNSGVIDNWMGDDEAVAQMFNKLRDSIYTSEDFYYAEIFGRVNQHCRRRRNKWKAALKKNYFNTPWSLISFLAAFALLLLTLLQTIFSVLSYFNQ